MRCSKCGRVHSGICGIPLGVILGFGTKVGRVNRQTLTYSMPGKPPKQRLSTAILENLLAQAQKHYVEVVKLLKVVPAEMTEYRDLLDRESKLTSLIKQIIEQINIRKVK